MKIYLFLILLILPLLGFNQNFGAGGAVLYNFQAEGLGAGVRVNFFPNKRLSIVPQYSRYFIGLSAIQVKEWTLGLSLEFKVLHLNKFNVYVLGHGGYNNWLNPEASAIVNASTSNLNGELGIGLTTNNCLRPFLEYRYNFKFQETHLQLGFLYVFGCGNDAGGYRNSARMKRGVVCPTYK